MKCMVIKLDESAMTVAWVQLGHNGSAILRRHRSGLPGRLCYQDLDVSALAEQIVAGARRIDGLGKNTSLVIPANWCYTHALHLPRKRMKDAALAYQLEEYLPATLEEVTCAFVRNGGDQALGLAIRTEPLQQLIATLSAADIFIETVTPDICCAAAAEQPSENDRPHGLLIRDGWRRTIALLNTHRDPILIRTIHVAEAPGHQEFAEQLSISEEAAGLRTHYWRIVDTENTQAADEIMLSSLNKRLPNLACGELSQNRRMKKTLRLTETTGVLLSILLISVLIGMFVQRHAYSKALIRVQSEQTNLYGEVFPGASLPPNPAPRMASERKRLEGITLQAGEEHDVGTTDRLRPFDVLRDVATYLPADVRIMLDTLAIDEHQLSLRGQTRDHRDAERIVEAIEQTKRLTAKAPSTSRLSNGAVEFTVRAILEDTPRQKVIHNEETNVATKSGIN